MNTHLALRRLALAGALALAACDVQDATAPFPVDEPAASLEDALTLETLQDETAVEAGVSLAEVSASAVSGSRSADGQAARRHAQSARDAFRRARHRLEEGDTAGAIRLAREARRRIADAVHRTGGTAGVQALVERAEDLALDVAADPGAVDDAVTLQAELANLAAAARNDLAAGSADAAADRAVLAEQRHRQRQRPDRRHGGAEVAVQLGSAAVALADRILEGTGADDEQLRFLEQAHEFQRQAEAALDAGEDRRAAHLAHMAQWTALKAVVLPGGVTEEEARAMVELAHELLDVAIASEPTGVKAQILERLPHLIAKGEEMLEQGQPRGIGALWRAAVAASWIAG